MKIEILICTTVHRLHQVAKVLLSPMDGVGYVVSCQGGEPTEEVKKLFVRPDVRLVWMQGTGLSRNRNHAFAHAKGDILVIADDDNPLCAATIQGLQQDFENHPQWDIIQYRMHGSGKSFPALYVSSCELVMRRIVAQRVSFDERFGLGSQELSCGEEEVFVSDAQGQGFGFGQLDKVLCTVDGSTTGDRFLTDVRVQRSKGATFARTHGLCYAYYKCSREALGYLLRRGVNPLPLLRNMFWGIRYACR